jgi:intracellular multiplication protein IcmB
VYTNTVGQQMLWAFSTTTEDAVVRNALYDRIGTSATLILLSKMYPGGIKVEVERRKRGQIYDELCGSNDVLNELIEELANTWPKIQKKTD